MSRITPHRAPLARLTGLIAATALGVAMTAAPAPAAAPPDSSLQTVSNLVAPLASFKYARSTTCSGFIVNANGRTGARRQSLAAWPRDAGLHPDLARRGGPAAPAGRGRAQRPGFDESRVSLRA